MKKIVLSIAVALAVALLAATSLSAQTATHVTATVHDSSSIPYSFATVSAQLVPTGTNPTINGAQISATARTQATINGVINFDLWPTNQITPSGSMWQITVCESPGILPPLGTGSQCFNLTTTITGTSQDLSTAMNAIAPALTNITVGSGTVTGTGTAGDCAQWTSTTAIGAVAFPCGSTPGSPINSFQFNLDGVHFGGTSGLSWNDTSREADLVNAGNSAFFSFAPGAISFAPTHGSAAPSLNTLFNAYEMTGGGGDDLVFGQAGTDNDHHFVLPANDFGRANFGISTHSGKACLNDGVQATGVFSGSCVISGTGSPEGAVTGVIGSLFLRTDGGASTALYVKTSGTGNTGWAAATPAATTVTIASGTKALATASIASGACTASQTAAATGTLTTDNVMVDFNADPTGVTGYAPVTTGMLTIIKYPTADTVNVKVCNLTGAAITPGAITLNYRVVR